MEPSNTTHVIQLAIAPVFLLTAVAGMIGAVAGRLARIIDRGRKVDDAACKESDLAVVARARAELVVLRRRGHLANLCIALLTLCGVMIGLTIVFLFLEQTTTFFQGVHWAMGSFLAGVICFLFALLSFFIETLIASQVLNFQLLNSEI